MNADNHCHLTGVVVADPHEGACWTRWRTKPTARGQVRFWLGVARELAGDGQDVLLCAIEPATAEELARYQAELRAGRTVRLTARAARVPYELDALPPECAAVVFVAESCGFDGTPEVDVHRKVPRPHGKLAAAADDSALPGLLGGAA